MLQRHPIHEVVLALPPTPTAWEVAQRVLWTRLLDVTPTLWRPLTLQGQGVTKPAWNRCGNRLRDGRCWDLQL